MYRRNAFTLVELLVVIAIIGILIGISMPAIQAAREAARKTSCSNNLRQIALGLSLYESTHQAFPIGGLETHFLLPQPRKQIAWNVALLPYLEKVHLYDKFNYNLPFHARENLESTRHVVNSFVCPSSGRGKHTTGDINGNGVWDPGDDMGITDYGGMHGLSKPPYLPFSQLKSPWVHSPQYRGGMSYEIGLPTAAFWDGLSNTVVVAECVRGNVYQSQWANGQNLFDQVHTNPINETNNNEIFSMHPAGAFVVFADAHVKYLSETMNQQVLNSLLTRAGGEAVPRF